MQPYTLSEGVLETADKLRSRSLVMTVLSVVFSFLLLMFQLPLLRSTVDGFSNRLL